MTAMERYRDYMADEMLAYIRLGCAELAKDYAIGAFRAARCCADLTGRVLVFRRG